MKKFNELRKCIHCGAEWEVIGTRHTASKRRASTHLLCPHCAETLTAKEKSDLYRLHSGNFHKETRTCIHCGKQWEVIVENGKEPDRIKHFCSECNKSLSNRDKRRILREKLEGYHDKEKRQRNEAYKRNHIHAMVANAKTRAIKYGYDFDLEDKDIIIPDKCPLLEVPFILGSKGNYEYTPTIDRIDNTKGYTKDNIWIITKKANSMKNSATFAELDTFCKNILRYSLNTREVQSSEQEDKEPLG